MKIWVWKNINIFRLYSFCLKVGSIHLMFSASFLVSFPYFLHPSSLVTFIAFFFPRFLSLYFLFCILMMLLFSLFPSQCATSIPYVLLLLLPTSLPSVYLTFLHLFLVSFVLFKILIKIVSHSFFLFHPCKVTSKSEGLLRFSIWINLSTDFKWVVQLRRQKAQQKKHLRHK